MGHEPLPYGSYTMPWGGQVASFLAMLDLPHDLNAPQAMDMQGAVVRMNAVPLYR